METSPYEPNILKENIKRKTKKRPFGYHKCLLVFLHSNNMGILEKIEKEYKYMYTENGSAF